MKGVAIPGLAMRAAEIPSLPGLVTLENPEVGAGVRLPGDYSLEDVAEIHARHLATAQWDPDTTPTLIGMSMGGMILSILATRLRKALPERCKFRFLVTSANTGDLPAIPEALLDSWRVADPTREEELLKVLGPFFSPSFRENHAAEVRAYCRYRATGGNQQSPREFLRQVSAVRRFNGELYFRAMNPTECEIIGGSDDQILGVHHQEALCHLSPRTPFRSIAGLGHMVNIELPSAFSV